jgi:hypothetical protein
MPETHMLTPLYELVAEPRRLGAVAPLAALFTVLALAVGCVAGMTRSFLRLGCASGCEPAGNNNMQTEHAGCQSAAIAYAGHAYF